MPTPTTEPTTPIEKLDRVGDLAHRPRFTRLVSSALKAPGSVADPNQIYTEPIPY